MAVEASRGAVVDVVTDDDDTDDGGSEDDLMDYAAPLYWVSEKVGTTTHLRGGRQYKVHMTKPGCPEKLGCSEKLANMVPVGREVSEQGAVCLRCAKFRPDHFP